MVGLSSNTENPWVEIRIIHAAAFRCTSLGIERRHSAGTRYTTRGKLTHTIHQVICHRFLYTSIY